MQKFSNAPYDVFSAILVMTDVECLHTVGQCNRYFRELAGTNSLWKEVIRHMQERGIQLPMYDFTKIDNLSTEQLKRSALRAYRIYRNWSSPEARPRKTELLDFSPARYMHGVFHPTQRLRWIVPINSDFFAVKLGYHLSSGLLQIWKYGGEAPRITVNYHHDWITWGHCTDPADVAWYFLYSEHNVNQHGHTMYLARFSGFNCDSKPMLDMSIAAKFPTYGSPMNVFFLNTAQRKLCVVYSGSPTGTITLFYIPDWSRKASVHIDTGIKEYYRNAHTFICTWDATLGHLMLQFDAIPRREVCQYIYTSTDLEQFVLSEPAFPYPLPHPPLLEPYRKYRLFYVDTPPDQGPFHEVRRAISYQHHFTPVLQSSSDFRSPPLCSALAFASSFGRDFNPTYVLQHYYVGLPGLRPFIRRSETLKIRRMAFAQDYMDTNTTERFPVGHSFDLRGHELVALGHGCAAWIEAREPAHPYITPNFDEVEFELKLALFPWVPEEGGRGGMPRDIEDLSSTGPLVCTIMCPSEVELAKVTGIWLDIVQGRIFLGLKWGKVMVLHFD